MNHFTDPGSDSPDDEEFEDTERTVEELAEMVASGSVIEVFPCEEISFTVSLERVSAHVHVPLDAQAVAALAAGLPSNHLDLRLPEWSAILDGLYKVDAAEQALLGRAIAARKKAIESWAADAESD